MTKNHGLVLRPGLFGLLSEFGQSAKPPNLAASLSGIGIEFSRKNRDYDPRHFIPADLMTMLVLPEIKLSGSGGSQRYVTGASRLGFGTSLQVAPDV